MTPYTAESQLPGLLPVFRLKVENGQVLEKVQHGNHILPIRQEVQLQRDTQTYKESQ